MNEKEQFMQNTIVAAQILFAGCRFTLAGVLTLLIGSGVAMLIYMAFISAVAYSLWGILLKYNPIFRVAVFGFMNPVFGVILSALLLGEADSLGIMSAVALVLVCVGIYVVNRGTGTSGKDELENSASGKKRRNREL